VSFGKILVTNTGGNNWEAKYKVDIKDSSGEVTFVISSYNLDAEYIDTTDGTIVIVDKSVMVSRVETFLNRPPVCVGEKPSGVSDLFQIDMKFNSATVFFTPINNTFRYYISFSENQNAEEHGEEAFLLSEGVQSHTVHYLKSNTRYYFKVRGVSGCVSGEWSNILMAKTGSATNRVTYYKYFPFLLNTSTLMRNIFPIKFEIVEKPVALVTPAVPALTEEKVIEINKKKRCFLWWCI
jgi:hypothetical protein